MPFSAFARRRSAAHPPKKTCKAFAQNHSSGTDVARECADVVLIGNDLEKFVETVRIARRCRAIIFQNFYGTLIVDTIGIGMAAAGLLNPLLVAFIHVASELIFIPNSTRLLPRRQRKPISIQERAPAHV
jgi:cation transport ATPase